MTLQCYGHIQITPGGGYHVERVKLFNVQTGGSTVLVK